MKGDMRVEEELMEKIRTRVCKGLVMFTEGKKARESVKEMVSELEEIGMVKRINQLRKE